MSLLKGYRKVVEAVVAPPYAWPELQGIKRRKIGFLEVVLGIEKKMKS